MKAQTFLPALVLALGAAAVQDAICDRTDDGGQYTYDIWAGNVGDISGICKGLWDNLNRFPECAGKSTAYCGGDQSTNLLNLNFQVNLLCDSGRVESAWWEATRNQFGAIHCKSV